MPTIKRKRAKNMRHPGMKLSTKVPQFLYEHVEGVAATNNESISAALVRIIAYHNYATTAGVDTTIED